MTPLHGFDAARLANRLLRWHLDADVVDRGRVTWLCDRVLHAADYTAVDSVRAAPEGVSAEADEVSQETDDAIMLAEERPLEIPDLLQEAQVRTHFALQANQATSPNVVPLPEVRERGPCARSRGSMGDCKATAYEQISRQGPRRPSIPMRVSESSSRRLRRADCRRLKWLSQSAI